jgi:hypothetical protein
MYKLLLGLGVIDLAFQFPQLTTLTLVGVFLYNNLTDEDKQQLMSIYSNGKEFSKYLANKAKELGITLPELRKQMVVDLEIPESTATGLDNLLEDYLSVEDINKVKEDSILIERVARSIKESLEMPDQVWVDSNLELFLANDDLDGEFKEFLETHLPNQSLDNTFTSKDYRQLQTKVKSLYRNAAGEIIDEELEKDCLYFLKHLKAYFTDNYDLLY